MPFIRCLHRRLSALALKSQPVTGTGTRSRAWTTHLADYDDLTAAATILWTPVSNEWQPVVRKPAHQVEQQRSRTIEVEVEVEQQRSRTIEVEVEQQRTEKAAHLWHIGQARARAARKPASRASHDVRQNGVPAVHMVRRLRVGR